MIRDFTLEKFGFLCQSALEAGYRTLTIKDYLSGTADSIERPLMFRHDVDRALSTAVNMARVESDLGIRATYYFRDLPGLFDPRVLEAVANLGHEVGYHYETLALAKGDLGVAIELFKTSLEKMRQYVPVDTISMHGRPFSRYDSRDIWKAHDYRNFGLLGEAYLSIDYCLVKYFCDTGRTWHSSRYNIRDRVSVLNREPEIDKTDELIEVLAARKYSRLCISCHPNRWRDEPLAWFREAISDGAINLSKLVVKRLVA